MEVTQPDAVELRVTAEPTTRRRLLFVAVVAVHGDKPQMTGLVGRFISH